MLVWLLPLSVMVFASRSVGDLERASIPTPEVAWVRVGERMTTLAQPATVQWSRHRSPDLRSPRAGRVTARHPDVGRPVGNAAELIDLDGVVLRVLVGGLPMYRQLSQGMSGADVAELNSFLSALGVGGETADVSAFTSATSRAVEAFDRLSGRTPDGVFTPEDVVYSPTPVTVSAWSIDLGVDVAAGDSLVAVDGSVERVDIIGSSPPGVGEVPDGVAVRLSTVEDAIEVSSLHPRDAGELESVASFLERHSVAQFGADGSAPSAPSTPLTVELSTPVRSGTVPGSAIASVEVGEAELSCVVVRGPAGRLESRAVQVMASPEVGVAAIDPSLVGSLVLADVTARAEIVRRSCR